MDVLRIHRHVRGAPPSIIQQLFTTINDAFPLAETRFSVQELGIIPVIGLDFQSGDLQDTVDIVEYGPLHNRSVAHPFLLAAFHSKFTGVQVQPASVPLVESTFDGPVMIFICRFRCC